MAQRFLFITAWKLITVFPPQRKIQSPKKKNSQTQNFPKKSSDKSELVGYLGWTEAHFTHQHRQIGSGLQNVARMPPEGFKSAPKKFYSSTIFRWFPTPPPADEHDLRKIDGLELTIGGSRSHWPIGTF